MFYYLADIHARMLKRNVPSTSLRIAAILVDCLSIQKTQRGNTELDHVNCA